MLMRLSRRRVLVLVAVLALPVASRAQSGSASLEVDFTVPSGYVARQEGDELWIRPPTTGQPSRLCSYAISPPRASKGSQEADAEAALIDETVGVGMRRTNDYRIAMRGVAAAGWDYFLSGGHFQGQTAVDTVYLTVMAMVFPAPANRVTVLFVVGDAAGCTLNDLPFAQLFHSLRPRGWQNPAVNALERDLIGAWEGSALSGHTFHADGRYSSSAAGALFGEAVSRQGGGRYALRGSEITVTSGVAGQAPERFRVYIYDKWNNSRWQRAMTVLYDDRKPANVAEYVRPTK